VHADLPQHPEVGAGGVTGLQFQWHHAGACGHHMPLFAR
jgi:hypothetical protein